MADGDGTVKTFTQEQVDAEVKGLKAKNEELLGKLRDATSALEPWKGLDAAKVKEVLTAHEEATANKQKAQGDWDAREKKLRDDFKVEHDKVVGPLSERVTALEADLFDAIAVRDAVEAMSDPEIKANPKLILPLLRSELGVAVVEGKRVTVVKGPDGKPRYHQTNNSLVSVKDRLKELRGVKDYAGGFEGTVGGGSGAKGSDAGGGTVGTIPAGDEKAFLANVGKIAKGEVKVA